MVVSILIATVHAAVTVVVHGAIAHVQLVHHIHHTHDNLWIMCGITVNLNVKDVTTTCHLMIGCLDFSLMACTTFIIDGNMV